MRLKLVSTNVPCPRCGAKEDELCVTDTGKVYDAGYGVHVARSKLYGAMKRLPMGEVVMDTLLRQQ